MYQPDEQLYYNRYNDTIENDIKTQFIPLPPCLSPLNRHRNLRRVRPEDKLIERVGLVAYAVVPFIDVMRLIDSVTSDKRLDIHGVEDAEGVDS
jgi:hypothetical protein